MYFVWWYLISQYDDLYVLSMMAPYTLTTAVPNILNPMLLWSHHSITLYHTCTSRSTSLSTWPLIPTWLPTQPNFNSLTGVMRSNNITWLSAPTCGRVHSWNSAAQYNPVTLSLELINRSMTPYPKQCWPPVKSVTRFNFVNLWIDTWPEDCIHKLHWQTYSFW